MLPQEHREGILLPPPKTPQKPCKNCPALVDTQIECGLTRLALSTGKVIFHAKPESEKLEDLIWKDVIFLWKTTDPPEFSFCVTASVSIFRDLL